MWVWIFLLIVVAVTLVMLHGRADVHGAWTRVKKLVNLYSGAATD